MIFLSAAEPNLFIRVYGVEFFLEPIHHPDVDITNIIAMEGALGKRILEGNRGRLHRISFDTEKFPNFPKPFKATERVAPGSRVMVIRGGGIGDVMMCTPVLREIKNRLPADAQLMLSTFKENIPLFETNPHLDAVLPQPLTLAEFLKVDYYLEFTAPATEISRIHLTDFYLSKAGIDPAAVSDKRPDLDIRSLFEEETADLIEKRSSGFRNRIYLNGIASDRLRDVPPSILQVFVRQWPDIFFFIPKPYTERYPEAEYLLDAPNACELDTRNRLSVYVTAVDCCHMTVTTDSSAYHIAAALGKPCLTLFGPIDPALRTRYYPTVVPLEARYQGQTCQSPCGKSMISEFSDDRFDREKKCPEALSNRTDFSPCLGSISENRLTDAFNRMSNMHKRRSAIGAEHWPCHCA